MRCADRSAVSPDACASQAAGAPAGLALDLLQLASLAASASSAASATAYAVDAVVKEALLFFAIMPQDVGLEALGRQRAGTGAGEEVFRVFGQRAHADARAANDACALAHQLVANASRGGRSAGSLSGGNLLAAALAAGRVGTHADRTAATAREGAQLCMGILEDAVQVNASALARETAKRCAEQALRSIEAATRAEQHSRSLRDVLAHTLSAAELQARAHSGNAGLPTDTLAALAAAPTVPSRQPSPSFRWWQEIDLMSVPKEASIAGRSYDVPVLPADGLARHLEAAVRRCRPDEASEDDMQALAALVEWRFAKAASLGLQEEEVLPDDAVRQLACWQSPTEEVPCRLPPELQNHVNRCGQSLILALKAAFFQPGDAQEVFSSNKARRMPFPGTFQTPRRGVAAEEGEWENLCDQLGWVSSVNFKFDKAEQGQDLASAVATAQSWAMAKTAEAEDLNQVLDPTDQDWSVDHITLRQLHALSNRSRSSKTQSKRTVPPTASAAEKPSAQSSQSSTNTVDDEAQVRAILADLLGEWEKVQSENLGRRGFVEEEALPRKGVPGLSSVVAFGGSDPVSMPLQRPTSGVAAGASMPSSSPGYTIPGPGVAWQQRTAISQTAGPTRVKQTPLGLGVDLLNAGGSEPATVEVSASSPVHKLVEPPHLLRTALESTEDDQDDEDGIWPLETELPTNRKLHSFGEFHAGRGSSYLPGQLLQQRLPRTFNESLGHAAQERREAYGVPGLTAGLGRGFPEAWPPRSLHAAPPDDDWLLSNRARTFNGSLPGDRCGSSPVQTPAGTFIATPTWSESGEFATRREDPCSPLYIQATPQRWASEHCQEMSQPSTGLSNSQVYHGFAGLLASSDPQSFYRDPSL